MKTSNNSEIVFIIYHPFFIYFIIIYRFISKLYINVSLIFYYIQKLIKFFGLIAIIMCIGKLVKNHKPGRMRKQHEQCDGNSHTLKKTDYGENRRLLNNNYVPRFWRRVYEF